MTGSDTSDGAAAKVPRHRRRNLAVALCLAVLAGAGLGTWTTGTWPFAKERFCWGAWQEDDGDGVPEFLAEDTDGYERTSEQSAPPRKGERATCSVTLKEKPDDSATESEEDTYAPAPGTSTQRVSVEVGPVPRRSEARRAWLADHLDARLAALPHGLPGLVGTGRSVFVLPTACDTADGRPTVVTVEGASFRTASPGDSPGPLMSLVNTVARKAGCAPEKPYEITLPIPVADGDHGLEAQRSPLCRIPGFRFNLHKDDHFEARIGPVEKHVQTCSVEDKTQVRNPTFAGQFVMTSQPRLTALFTGLADNRPLGKGWRGKGRVDERQGLLTASCQGEPTVFFMQLDGLLADRADPSPRRAFEAAVNSVADRIGCPSVAPRS
ncbi:hypothetical protein ITI46_33005 [Streptomyces oryzae]|uniref:DUF3558 domain-containing protein n=1 Tax=Streptomyces oryzae TaxID=1434886 RepID=A0ABS3XM74_9ACTN|nr:hypothetical protein [Streptomyces oryzae]MBO8196419.1 hypothetical protein [Streptomyces oryzae]